MLIAGSNKLTTLPPEVRHLKNLHTLNVSNNQLQYLPAEIFDMKLEVLNVFPNPFKEEPSPTFIRAKSQRRVAVSSPSRNSQRVPALVELTLRSLFSTDSGNTTDHAERRIERYYELPLCEADVASSGSGKKEFRQVIPPHLRNVLDAIHPGSVDPDISLEPGADDRPSLGLCPAAHHRKASVFVTPAEERYTWETVVASVDVGGRVPLKWRGCLWGCLDFLGIGIEPETPHVDTTEMDVDGEQEVVTRLQFDSSNGFDMADFEDDG